MRIIYLAICFTVLFMSLMFHVESAGLIRSKSAPARTTKPLPPDLSGHSKAKLTEMKTQSQKAVEFHDERRNHYKAKAASASNPISRWAHNRQADKHNTEFAKQINLGGNIEKAQYKKANGQAWDATFR